MDTQRNLRASKASASAAAAASVALTITAPYTFRYICLGEGCQESSNTAQEVRRHARQGKCNSGKTDLEDNDIREVPWLEWLAGRTKARVPEVTYNTHKHLLTASNMSAAPPARPVTQSKKSHKRRASTPAAESEDSDDTDIGTPTKRRKLSTRSTVPISKPTKPFKTKAATAKGKGKGKAPARQYETESSSDSDAESLPPLRSPSDDVAEAFKLKLLDLVPHQTFLGARRGLKQKNRYDEDGAVFWAAASYIRDLQTQLDVEREKNRKMVQEQGENEELVRKAKLRMLVDVELKKESEIWATEADEMYHDAERENERLRQEIAELQASLGIDGTGNVGTGGGA